VDALDFAATLGDFGKDLAYSSVLRDIKNNKSVLTREYNASTALEYESAVAKNASEVEGAVKSFERADGFYFKFVAAPAAVLEFGLKSYGDIMVHHERPEHALIKEGVSTALPLVATVAAGVVLAPFELPVLGAAIGVATGVWLLDKAKVINGKSLTEWAGESAADFITHESGKGAYQDGYGPPAEN
jgi:hypothetical protein